MWKNALHGTAMADFEGLEYYRGMKRVHHNLCRDICASVVDGINAMPWYLSQPLCVYAFFINILCLMLTGSLLANISAERRQHIMPTMEKVPFFRIYHKFVRAKVYLKLFDAPLAS